MKKIMVFATVVAFALGFSGLAFAAAADVSLEGKILVKNATCPKDCTKECCKDKPCVQLSKDQQGLKKDDKIALTGDTKDAKAGEGKVTGSLDAGKKQITVKKIEMAKAPAAAPAGGTKKEK